MSVIAFASVKSSPGATTAAVVTAHVWPAEETVLVVEADPAGGDLAARWGRSPEPGLATLAASGRRALSPELVARHTQEAGGLAVLFAPPAGAPVRAALEVMGPSLGPVLHRLGADVLVDCGRLDPGSPALPLARAADFVVVVCRPTVAELPRVAARTAELAAESCTPALVLVGDASVARRDRYPADEVAEATGIPVVGTLADDARGAEQLFAGRGIARALERSPLVRSARDVAGALLARLDATARATATTSERRHGFSRVRATAREATR